MGGEGGIPSPTNIILTPLECFGPYVAKKQQQQKSGRGFFVSFLNSQIFFFGSFLPPLWSTGPCTYRYADKKQLNMSENAVSLSKFL